MDDKEKEKQKRIDQIRKQIHPHDDEPDPTAYMGNYNFPHFLYWICDYVCFIYQRDRKL